MTLLSGDISVVPVPEKASSPQKDREGPATQHVLPSLTCAPFCVHRPLSRQQKRGQQTRQAETGTATKTQQGEQRLPGEPEEQALYVNPSAQQPGLPPPLGFLALRGVMAGRAWQGGLG